MLKLERYHNKILEWEQTICSSNHYFMDTVNLVKAQVYDEDPRSNGDRPEYLQGLTAESIRSMSNEDQKLVDIQIELFAYWKLMKKRMIDYIILSTHSELVNTPIDQTIKRVLMDAVFGHDNLVRLLSQDPTVEKTRVSVTSRLEKLRAAMADIQSYKKKHPGGWIEME